MEAQTVPKEEKHRGGPACPEGWVTGPPDVVGVGAQRCGTTWWFRQIARHPMFSFSYRHQQKEVAFFNDLRHFRRLPDHYAALYAQHFPRPPGAGPTGEWTPEYMYYPWAMGQLRQAAPDSRILVLLRDPVARYASGYAREMRIQRKCGDPRVAEEVIEDQVARGFYSRQLQRVFETFSRDRVLVLQYERCRLNYESELDRTFEFIGVEPGFRPRQDRWSRTPAERRVEGFAHNPRGRLLAEAYAGDAARLAEIAPEIDLSLWPSVRDLV
jgi:hypothetical protein